MTGYTGKNTNFQRDVTGSQTRADVEAEWGEMSGEVIDFDIDTQEATVQPLYKKRLNGDPVQLPELQKVPVRFPRMGGHLLTFPVNKGDKVTLRPQMRNSEAYHVDGDFTAPDARTNSLSDYEAFIDGGEPIREPIKNFNNNAFEVRNEDGSHRMRFDANSGKFEVTGNQGDWYDIVAEVVELLAADTLVINYGSSAGSGHQLEHQAQYAALAARLRAMAGAAGP